METQKTLTRLTLKQGRKVTKVADERYTEEVLGGEPSRAKIRANNINPDPITIMQWLAVVFISGILVYAWLKVQPAAQLYADTFQAGNEVFGIATGVVFGLIATIGFIFFKIMTEDESVLKRQEENPLELPHKKGNKQYIGNWWKIEVWSPRMFGILTYMVLVWHVAIAITGIHNYQNPIEWLNALLPVLIEIGLATTVAKVLTQFRTWRNVITKTLITQKTTFKEQYDLRHTDERYLTILFQELRETLSSMKGNQWLQTASSEITRKVITQEYERLTAGQQFALDVFSKRAVNAGVSAEIAEQQAVIDEAKEEAREQRVPPNGAERWTPETLMQDFLAREDIKRSMVYTQKDLDRDYATGYAVRVAFRGTNSAKDGAKWYFNTTS